MLNRGAIDKIKISELFIGKADGLKEAQEKNFEELFYTGNNTYKELVEDKTKFIISGKNVPRYILKV